MNYYNELIKLTKKAYKKGEVPIAAIIVKNNKIISKAYNLREKNNDVLGHAEIIAIKKATKKLKTWHLNDCILYSTVEPCDMCKSIINEAKIDKVYFFLKNEKLRNSTTKYIFLNKIDNEFKKIIKDFFKKIR